MVDMWIWGCRPGQGWLAHRHSLFPSQNQAFALTYHFSHPPQFKLFAREKSTYQPAPIASSSSFETTYQQSSTHPNPASSTPLLFHLHPPPTTFKHPSDRPISTSTSTSTSTVKMQYSMITLGAFVVSALAQVDTLPSCGVSRSFSLHLGSNC